MTPKEAGLDAIKALREKTSASLRDVREALEQAGGDERKALEWLKKRGAAIAQARQGRATGQGRIEAYVHHDGRLGALVDVRCETDFVARTTEFVEFCRALAMHVAAMNPEHIREEDLPASRRTHGDDAGSRCLLRQPFVKDPTTTVADLLQALVAKTGENIVIARLARFAVGD